MKKKRRSETDGLSKAELKLLHHMFEELADINYTNYDEFEIDASDENKDLMKNLVLHMYDEDDIDDALEMIEDSKDEILVEKSRLFNYFEWRLQKLTSK